MRFPESRLLPAASLLFLAGCGTLEGGRGWGQDATLTPGWERIREAAWTNAKDPLTWAPILGAGLLQIDDMDERISDWARDETPIFGSTEHAEQASDTWRSVSYDLWLASVFATPSGDSFGEWAWSKTKGATVEILAKAASRGVTSVPKDACPRTRPRGDDDRSFPSGHMTEAFGNSVLGARNLDSVDLPAPVLGLWRVALYGAGAATGWARVEAGAHFPSDVLFASGATHFVVGFLHDAFLGLGANPEIVLARGPSDDGFELGLRWTQ